MTWAGLSMKEWRRRPLRTGVTAAGVAIAIAALFSLLAFQRGYQDGLRLELDGLGAHVLVVPKGCPYDAASMALHGANWPCYLKGAYLDEVRAARGVAMAAPCFMAALSQTDGSQIVYEGVDANILSLRRNWKIAGKFPERDGDLLAGSEAARKFGWELGGEVVLPGLKGQSGRVVGILSPTQGAEDAFVYLGLSDAQKRFGHSNELTHVLVQLKDPNQLDETVSALRGCDAGLAMNVVPLAHVYGTIQSLVNSTRVLLACIAVVALLVAGAGVSNAILMSVAERTRDIGVMRAMGATTAQVFRMILQETVQVCALGALAGGAIAFLFSRSVENWVRARLPYSPTGALIHWDWMLAALCVGLAILLGSLAGLLPAWRAAQVSPMRAIRSGGGRA